MLFIKRFVYLIIVLLLTSCSRNNVVIEDLNITKVEVRKSNLIIEDKENFGLVYYIYLDSYDLKVDKDSKIELNIVYPKDQFDAFYGGVSNDMISISGTENKSTIKEFNYYSNTVEEKSVDILIEKIDTVRLELYIDGKRIDYLDASVNMK